jgi:anti-sigma regulatory factor (Ser/Thr protein kinase)
MEDLSLHILDIVENATNAGATLVEIYVKEETRRNLLEVVIRDNGRGMDPEVLKNVLDPFVTTRTTRRVGLGLPMLDQATKEANGSLTITSKPGQGTEVTAVFQANHIDRKPLGDMGSTMVSLIAGSPEVDFLYEADFDGERISLDTRTIKAEIDGVTTINDPAVLKLIRNLFKK